MMLDFLFTSTQQRLLRILFGHVDRSFYANELIAMAGIGTGAVQRELLRMEKAGLVSIERIGNQKHYRANPACPIFEEIRAIVRKTLGVTDVLRNALEPVLEQIDFAFVYGSVAEGTEHATSDIDVMVITASLSNAQLLRILAPAQAELGRTINPTLYTPDEFVQRVRERRSVILRVLAKPKLFIKGAERELAQISEPVEDRTAQS
ncbi:nucleotidyltransferase domain-containing protein [Massilia sp. IC2-278]|uniref:nucleotidyltransferase domain-containing protein n=1 Tax=Massilia sp. IC2-278 TaxID=2887200 RepID=UPI001E5FC1A8|nr:nucleotidyltransferase domain-containing protein [Massilia sp. IC2-278]